MNNLTKKARQHLGQWAFLEPKFLLFQLPSEIEEGFEQVLPLRGGY
jgi:hypothetical protein